MTLETIPTLSTQRLTLRAPKREDAPRVAQLCAEFDITRMTTRMPWPYSLSDAQGFIERAEQNDPACEAVFMIEDEEDSVIGCVGFHPAERLPEMGYWIGKPYWGRGYATEAVDRALAWAGEAWGKRAVTAGHFADNPASGSVLVKTGFLYTGDVELRPSRARGEEAPTRMMVWLA